MFHDITHAPEMAAGQGIRSFDLLTGGIVDRVIPEFPDAADESAAFCTRVGAVLHYELSVLSATDPTERLITRTERIDRIGLVEASSAV